MKINGFGLVVLLSLASCTHPEPPVVPQPTIDPCAHDKTTFRCVTYIRNYDADTITVNIPNVHPLIGEKIGVRVNGVDTPEIKGKHPCEKEAARTAQRLIESLLKNAQRIDLKNVARDKYFRILADVEVDGRLIKDLLLKNQLAYEYHGATKLVIDWCAFTKRKDPAQQNAAPQVIPSP